jgi:hypothetical protein
MANSLKSLNLDFIISGKRRRDMSTESVMAYLTTNHISSGLVYNN